MAGRTRVRGVYAGVLAAALGLAGCGSAPPEGGNPSSSPPPSSSRQPGEITVSGTVVAGVETGCLLLDTGDRRYLLLGGDRTRLEPGRVLAVRGTPRPGTPTTCMQGVPLEIREVSRPARR